MTRLLQLALVVSLSLPLSGCFLFRSTRPPKEDVQREMREQGQRTRSLDHPGNGGAQDTDADDDSAG